MEKFRYAQLLTIEGNDYVVSLKVEDIEKIDIKKLKSIKDYLAIADEDYFAEYKIKIHSKIGFFIFYIKEYELAPTLKIINALNLKIGEFER